MLYPKKQLIVMFPDGIIPTMNFANSQLSKGFCFPKNSPILIRHCSPTDRYPISKSEQHNQKINMQKLRVELIYIKGNMTECFWPY